MRNVGRIIGNPAAQIVSGLLFTYSKTSEDPENSISMIPTGSMSFLPLAAMILPTEVSSIMISMIMYMVNPYMQDE
jgi:hypothetical protein